RSGVNQGVNEGPTVSADLDSPLLVAVASLTKNGDPGQLLLLHRESAIEEVGGQGVVSLVITEVGHGVRVISQPHVDSSEDGCGRPFTNEAEGPITVRVSHLSHRPIAALGG